MCIRDRAVKTAFQENMSPFRQEIESKLNYLKREILERDESKTLHDVADNVQKLVTANLACSDKVSQTVKNKSENVTTVTGISTCQIKQGVKFDTINSALQRIKHRLEAVQVQKEQFRSTQAKGIEKVIPLESNQTKILGLVSSPKEDNNIVQERLNTLKKLDGAARGNFTPKSHDGAANKPEDLDNKFHDGAANKSESLDYKCHDGAAENSEPQKKSSSGNHEGVNSPCLEENGRDIKLPTGAKIFSTDLDTSKVEAARPTSVLNYPVKKDSP